MNDHRAQKQSTKDKVRMDVWLDRERDLYNEPRVSITADFSVWDTELKRFTDDYTSPWEKVRVSCYLTVDGLFEPWGMRWYADLYHPNEYDAKRAYQALAKLRKRYEKITARFGNPQGVEQFFAFVADAVGVTSIRCLRGMQGTYDDDTPMPVGALQYQIDKALYRLKKELNPDEAAV